MRQVVSWLVVLGVGCSSVPAVTPQGFRSSDVTELGALPPGYNAGEVVRAGCSKVAGEGAFENEPLGAVDCSFARLSRLLRAQAGDRSAKVIVGKRCRGHGGAHAQLECSATLAWPGQHVALAARSEEPNAGPAPSAEQVLDLDDPRPQDQDQIRVGFAPTAARRGRAFAPRDYASVDETHWPSVGRQQLGQISAHCDGCDANTLRYALRVTAGHVGAGEVTSVKCYQAAGGLSCVATALAPWSS
jgi:hypothetical protein